jgi:hypothetical protein
MAFGMQFQIPTVYLDYMSAGGPFEGFLDEDPGYFVLWSAEGIEENNRHLQLAEHAPGFLAFGGNGGGEILLFDVNGAIFMLPMIGLNPSEAILVAPTWVAFEEKIHASN